MKFIYQYYGNGIALGIYSETQEEIALEANKLYNWGATESEVSFVSPTFGYVLTDFDRLQAGWAKYFLSEFIENPLYIRYGEERLWEIALQKADTKINALTLETFLYERDYESSSTCQISNESRSTKDN